MEKKQTAIEWLVKTINYQIDYIPIKHWDSIRDIIQEAKEMEKEQIGDAWDSAYGGDSYYSGESYYNGTFKQQEQ